MNQTETAEVHVPRRVPVDPYGPPIYTCDACGEDWPCSDAEEETT